MRVALVHDWLNGMRGGEKCLECFCELFPKADLYTLIHTPGTCSPVIESMRIIPSFVNRLPGKDRYYRHMLPVFPTAIERFILKDYDLVLSSSHCVAKGIIPGPDTVHISYVYSPMRYVWDMYEEYFGPGKAGRLSGMVLPFFTNYLRTWDVASSARVDHFIGISGHVAKRIEKYYRREAAVIHPPVDLSRFSPVENPGDYYLIVSAFAPYKRIDLAIEAFNELGYPLKIVGTGQDESRLRQIAGPHIEFLGWQPDEALPALYAGCKAFVFPGEEDFGITPLEAMASGRPVIAYGRGGALETVRGDEQENPTGVFFSKRTSVGLVEAIKRFEKSSIQFHPEKIREHAKLWSRERFMSQVSEAIDEYLKQRA